MLASVKIRFIAFLCVCAGFCASAYTKSGNTATVNVKSFNSGALALEDLQNALADPEVATVILTDTITFPQGETTFLWANDLSSQERKVIQVIEPFLPKDGKSTITGDTKVEDGETIIVRDQLASPVIKEGVNDYKLFKIEAGSTVTISNLTLMGGFTGPTDLSPDSGTDKDDKDIASTGGIDNYGKLIMYNSTITRTGTAILNRPKASTVLVGCNIVRNANWYGGGILNFAEEDRYGTYVNGGTVVMDGCSLTENESLGPAHGGGAAENQGLMCLNNCVVANNASTEIGGGINNCKNGTLYVMNCTFTGNITTSQDYGVTAGGAIGNAGGAGNVHIVNSILANNGYDTGAYVNPVCLGRYDGASGDHQCTVINTVIGATAGMNRIDAANLSTKVEGLFSGYDTGGIVAAGGVHDGYSSDFSHPNVVKVGDEYALAPVMQSQRDDHYVYTLAVPTYFDYSAIVNGTGTKIGMAFETNGVVTVLGPDVAMTTELVDKTFNGDSREGRNNAIGAVTVPIITNPETPQGPGIFTVELGDFTGGKVSGVTIYKDSYISNSAVTVHAVADSAYYLNGWDINGTKVEGSEQKYIFTFRVIEDIVITPLFQPVVTGIMSARQRYPWNNLVDIDYMITEQDAVDYRLVFFAKFEEGGTNRTVQLKSFVDNIDGRTPKTLGAEGNGHLRKSGVHRVTWDSAADGIELKGKEVRFRLMACEGTER